MHLLVLRFSSIGDVVLTIPVLLTFQQQYPEARVTMVAPKMYRPLFEPLGFGFIAADLKGRHKGLLGLTKLFRQIRRQLKPDLVIDLHSVLRTHILKSLFKMVGTPFFSIDKGRSDKAQLTRKDDKALKQLPHTTQRYAQVFKDAGHQLTYDAAHPLIPKYQHPEAFGFGKSISTTKAIGLAPFAGFEGKTLPFKKIKQLVDDLLENSFTVVLFGGPADHSRLEELKNGKEQLINVAGKFDFAGDIVLMQSLKAMISMDSSNMHLATMAGIPVVSIWGATHSYAGFGALGKNEDLEVAVSTNDLDCRPCSVFGNKPCFRGDYACLNGLETSEILKTVELIFKPEQE